MLKLRMSERLSDLGTVQARTVQIRTREGGKGNLPTFLPRIPSVQERVLQNKDVWIVSCVLKKGGLHYMYGFYKIEIKSYDSNDDQKYAVSPQCTRWPLGQNICPPLLLQVSISFQ